MMRLPFPGLPRPAVAVPLSAALVATGFVGARLAGGSPLLSTGGDQAFVHHRARLDVLRYWHEFLDGEIPLAGLLQRADSEFPPLLHGATLVLGWLVGHGADAVLWMGLLWLYLLAASTGVATAQLVTLSTKAEAPDPGRASCSPTTAGAAAATAVLLLGSYQGMATRYYYDLPMTALLWAGAATLLATWDQRPKTGGFLAGLFVTAACLTKWTAVPFSLAMGLGLLLTGIVGNSPNRRERGIALVCALGVTTVLVLGFMGVSSEGGGQSSLEVMGGTFDAKSGRTLSVEDIRTTFGDYLAPESAPAPEPPSALVFRRELAAPDRLSSMVWADLDSNGERALIVGSDGDRDVMHPGPWSPPPLLTSALAVADVDNDGVLDLAIGAGGRGFRAPNRLHHGAGGLLRSEPGWLSTETDYTTSVDWGDWDGDGDPDLVVGNGSGPLPNRVYVNNGGRLEPTARWSSVEAEDTRAVAWGDWDGDGDPDLAVGNHLASNRIYVNEGGSLALAWTSPEEDETTSLAWGDWEGDGDLDLAVGNNLGGPTRVYLNGSNSFELGWTSIEADSTLDVAWADWDGDGDLDLAVANEDAPDRVYETEGGELRLAWSSPEVRRTHALAWGVDESGASELALGDAENNRILIYGPPTSPSPATAAASQDGANGPGLSAATPAVASRTEGRSGGDQDHLNRSVGRRLGFYPRWLVKSVLSPALTLPLGLLLLVWLLRSRAGLALFLSTVCGQLIFLLHWVPPLDERFIMTLVPALLAAAAIGWAGLSPLNRRRSAAAILAVMVLVCSDFHFRNSGAFTTSDPFVRLQSIEALGLDNASYADGAWRRGDAERRAIVAGSGIPGPNYRRFRRALWGVVERCEARRVVIGGSGSMVDDKDWWGYRVSLYDGRRGAAVINRPGVRVIQGIDLPGSMGAMETPDLVLAQLEGSAPATLPRGLEHLALRLDEEIRLEGMEPGIAAYRPAELAPCRRRDAP